MRKRLVKTRHSFPSSLQYAGVRVALATAIVLCFALPVATSLVVGLPSVQPFLEHAQRKTVPNLGDILRPAASLRQEDMPRC